MPSASAASQAQGDAETVTRGVPTSARIPPGAIVEREVEFALDDLKQVRLALRNPDFTTAERIAAAINERLGARHRAGGRLRHGGACRAAGYRRPRRRSC